MFLSELITPIERLQGVGKVRAADYHTKLHVDTFKDLCCIVIIVYCYPGNFYIMCPYCMLRHKDWEV